MVYQRYTAHSLGYNVSNKEWKEIIKIQIYKILMSEVLMILLKLKDYQHWLWAVIQQEVIKWIITEFLQVIVNLISYQTWKLNLLFLLVLLIISCVFRGRNSQYIFCPHSSITRVIQINIFTDFIVDSLVSRRPCDFPPPRLSDITVFPWKVRWCQK